MTESRLLPMVSRLLAEFFVIVLGVLVALAVDEWRDTQADIEHESEYLASLVQDLDRDVAEYQESIEMLSGSRRAIEHVLAAISGGEAENPYPSLSESLRTASWVNYPAWSSGTLSELVNSGSIRLIRDPELKRAILEYYERVEEWQPRLTGPEYATFIEYRRYTAAWLPPAMDPFVRDELSTEDLVALDQSLHETVLGDDELFAIASKMRRDWAMISGFMVFFAEQATILRDKIELSLAAQ